MTAAGSALPVCHGLIPGIVYVIVWKDYKRTRSSSICIHHLCEMEIRKHVSSVVYCHGMQRQSVEDVVIITINDIWIPVI